MEQWAAYVQNFHHPGHCAGDWVQVHVRLKHDAGVAVADLRGFEKTVGVAGFGLGLELKFGVGRAVVLADLRGQDKEGVAGSGVGLALKFGVGKADAAAGMFDESKILGYDEAEGKVGENHGIVMLMENRAFQGFYETDAEIGLGAPWVGIVVPVVIPVGYMRYGGAGVLGGEHLTLRLWSVGQRSYILGLMFAELANGKCHGR